MAGSVCQTQSRGAHNSKCFCELLGMPLRGSIGLHSDEGRNFELAVLQKMCEVWRNTCKSSERATEEFRRTHSEVSTGVPIRGP